ncbi:MAG TPA: hypothetical protein VGS28_04330 [Candidatus Saccharimonadales bacterium]|nr:hypothetical protein [Candidatus Saccharimonadales bacterium]
MGPLQITATQGGSTSLGLSLEVRIVTGAKPAAQQTGSTVGTQSTTPNLSITPTTTGSLVYAAGLLTNAAAPTAESGTTILSNPGNAGLYYPSYATTSTTTSGTPVLMGSSTGTGIAISVTEIVPSGSSVTEWSNQPTNASGVSNAITTGHVVPPPNSLLVAIVSSNGGSGTTTMSISDTWNLKWINLQQENGGGHGYVGIWIAQIPDPTPAMLYITDVSTHSTPTSAQVINYTPQGTKSLILCITTLYSSNSSVTSYNSITDNANNTWHYSTTASQSPPYAAESTGGQFYNTLIGWTWQDKGKATQYSFNFTGTAYVNMDISEWSGVGSIIGSAAASGTTGTSSMVGPTAPLIANSFAVSIINTINGTTAGPVTDSAGVGAASMPGEPFTNSIVMSGNNVSGQHSPYGFTWSNYGAGDDYSTCLLILAPPGAPSGVFFRLMP